MLRLAALVLLVMAAPLQAQAPADTLLTQLLEEAKAERWIVRVTADVAAHQGVIRVVSDTSLTIATHSIRLAEVGQLERRITSRGTLVGGTVVGAVTGAVLSAGFISWCNQDNNCNASTMFLLGGALTASGAAIGGVLGGLLGGYEWKTIWQRR